MEKKIKMVEKELEETLLVRRFYGDADEVVEEADVVEVRSFVTEPAVVSVEFGRTLNMGNYESIRYAVSVTLPCYVEELEPAYARARAWAQGKMQEIKEQIGRDAKRKLDGRLTSGQHVGGVRANPFEKDE